MSFKQFNFHHDINKGISECGYKRPTPIQEKTITPILKGKDVLGLAQTGTGKTAAFALPVLQRLIQGRQGRERALILAPTRELAEQIHETAVESAEYSVAVKIENVAAARSRYRPDESLPIATWQIQYSVPKSISAQALSEAATQLCSFPDSPSFRWAD